VASAVYRGIHHGIRRNGYDNFTYRAHTSMWEKVWLSLQARWRLLHLQCERRKVAASRSEVKTERAPVQKVFSIWARLTAFLQLSILGIVPTPTVMAQPDHAAVEQVRHYYLDSVAEASSIDSALVYLDARPALAADPLMRAYRGAFIVMKAKHAFWPFKKMAHLKQGLAILDTLTEQHPDHSEIRYLRLLSCYFLPGFLGRGRSVEEDAQALARLLPGSRRHFPPDLYQTMVRFLLEADILEALQHQALRASLVLSVASEGTAPE
jgi:hypothetical protein